MKRSLPKQLLPLALIACLASVALGQNPAAPELTMARAEDGKVTLAFGPVPGATEYSIRVETTDGLLEREIVNVPVTVYTVHGLTNNKSYRFTVRALKGSNMGAPSNGLVATPVDEPSWDTLEQAFAGKYPISHTNPFVMVHGNESEAALREMVRVAYDAGFEGITLHPYNYADYLGPGQWNRWRIVFDAAQRYGLAVWQQDDRNYPSGFAGGTVVAKNREFGRRHLTEAMQQSVTGPATLDLDLRDVLKDRQELVAVSAYGSTGDPLDLTDQVRDGRLAWAAPTGTWQVFVVTSVPYDDPFVDFMNPQAVDAYIEAIYAPTFAQLGEHFGRNFKGFFTDEAPVDKKLFLDGKLFTRDLCQRFAEAKGYSLRPRLPSLWRDLGPNDRRIRDDYHDFVREQIGSVFFGRIRTWCHEHNVLLIGHVVEHHLKDFRRLEFLDIPGFDQIFANWYAPQPDVYWRQARMASSVAHYNGVRSDIALVEHFAATNWRTGVTEMKRMMDWTTVMGLNQVVACGLDTQDPPIWEVSPDFWLHNRNPQWPHFRDYQTIANRMTMMMRGGRHVAPVIVLDTTEAEWALPQDVDADLHGVRDRMWRTIEALGRAHLDQDAIPGYVLADNKRTIIADGRIRIGKEEYQAVVLPPMERISVAVLERLREFHAAGGIVVAINQSPKASCNGIEDDKVKDIAEAIWGPAAAANGRSAVKSIAEVGAYLAGLGIEDVKIDPQLGKLLYVHRQLHGKDLYFLANTGNDAFCTTVEFRNTKGVPSLWDVATGDIIQAPRYETTDNSVRVWLDMAAWQSLFVVVDPQAVPQPHITVCNSTRLRRNADGSVVMEAGTNEAITCSWIGRDGQSHQQSFAASLLAMPLKIPDRWTLTPQNDMQHGEFHATVELPENWAKNATARIVIEGISQIASLQVNGRRLGERITTPYEFEAGDALHAGNNELVIRQIERYEYPVRWKTTANTDDPQLTYTGAWIAENFHGTHTKVPDLYNKTRHYTKEKDAAAEYAFNGSAFCWIGERAPNRGKAEVFIDGKNVAIVDTFANDQEIVQEELYRVDNLADGRHTVRIVCTGQKTDAAQDCYISIDGLFVGNKVPPPWSVSIVPYTEIRVE